MQLTTIMAFITALGGLEAIKWLVRFVTFRKMDVRKEEASINSMEAENRRKTVDWFEERLEQRLCGVAERTGGEDRLDDSLS